VEIDLDRMRDRLEPQHDLLDQRNIHTACIVAALFAPVHRGSMMHERSINP
jgi:hypothetical protein